jgi:hypothetical protein
MALAECRNRSPGLADSGRDPTSTSFKDKLREGDRLVAARCARRRGRVPLPINIYVEVVREAV